MDADALGSPLTGNGYSGYTPVDTLHSNSLLKMGYGGGGSNYEYYDNTNADASTAPLYGTAKKQKVTKSGRTGGANHSYDVYNYELQPDEDDGRKEEEDEEGGDDGDEEANYEDEIDSISSGSEKNTNSTSGNEESSNHALATPTYAGPAKPSTIVTTAALFNNNVSTSIGSGVESIKKHTYGLAPNALNGKY